MEDKYYPETETLDKTRFVYYYCSSAVFESILKNKELWLSDVSKSNDYAEIRIFFDSIIAELEKRLVAKESVATTCKGSSADRYVEVYRSAISALKRAKTMGYFFAICFTSLKDDLSQWRADGDDGRGLCIEIDLSKLERLQGFYCATDMMRLKKVSYCVEEMHSEIEHFVNVLDEIIIDNTSTKVKKKCWEWVKSVVCAAPYYKTEGFSVENEIRLCYARIITAKQMWNIKNGSHLEKVGFRVTKNDCVPYMIFPINKIYSVISGITIGPRNQASEDIVRFMLAKYRFARSVTVCKSKVTYRGK